MSAVSDSASTDTAKVVFMPSGRRGEFPIDTPVLTAEHGRGNWEFEEYAANFQKFLQSLAK